MMPIQQTLLLMLEYEFIFEDTFQSLKIVSEIVALFSFKLSKTRRYVTHEY